METEQPTFKLLVNYDKESVDKGLIKIIPNDGVKEVVIDADQLLTIIGTKIQGKGIAIQLSEMNRQEIWMMSVQRTFSFKALKDYKEGEFISLEGEHPYPVLLYAAEMEFGTCKEGTDKTFYAISTDGLTDRMRELAKNNIPIVNHMLNLNKEESHAPFEPKNTMDENLNMPAEETPVIEAPVEETPAPAIIAPTDEAPVVEAPVEASAEAPTVEAPVEETPTPEEAAQ